MKIAYITAEIFYNANFAFYHDLLTNYPKPSPEWFHRLYLVSPAFDVQLVHRIKDRHIEFGACFELFQKSTDIFWEKIRQETEDCDVLISGNITNLDEILSEQIQIPIISVSLAEKGYRSPSGGYGSFYKPRFHKVAISKTAVKAFPKHVQGDVQVVYNGIDASRLTQRIQRQDVRANWFGIQADDYKLILFVGTHQDSKRLDKVIDSLGYLPQEWHLIVLGPEHSLDVSKIPEHLRPRVHRSDPTYYVADVYLACDCFVLPTEHEGMSNALLEAWYLGVPTVTTRHNAMLELMAKHPGVDFGKLVDLDVEPKELARAVEGAVPSDDAQQCMFQHYTSSNMVEGWKKYLEGICT